MRDTSVDIICPNCQKKAIFYSQLTGTYVLYPDKNGRVICIHCGMNSDYKFSNNDYYYQIPIGSRILYARSLDNLITLKKYFEQRHFSRFKNIEPTTDFSKEFYKREKEIVKKINMILEKEKDII